MSKRQFKSQASSSRAVSGALGAPFAAFGTGTLGGSSAFGAVSTSPLSYVYEPPDLSGISDPNIVVAFKNAQKKDSTTKEKALEDLQTYVLLISVETSGLEDAILEAWIKIYPRTSIDSSRRVRHLAHTLQGQIALSCGKRIARHMPKLMGAWLSGLYDNDRLVIRAAQESFSKVFSSEDKRKNVWRAYQVPITEYCRDAILTENVRTLSDERTTSPDDAEAKYARVMGTSILVVVGALDILSPEEIVKQRPVYQELLGEDHIWKLSSYPDSFVRRAVYRLLVAVLAKEKDLIDLHTISTHFLMETLHIEHTGSAYEYAKALTQLSIGCPDIWTRYYPKTTKKSAAKRLCQFFSKGSQGGPPDFWNQISVLLDHVPVTVLAPEQSDAQGQASSEQEQAQYPLLEAMHHGVTHKDESRTNQSIAWQAYLKLAGLIQPSVSNIVLRRQFLESSLVPIIVQYVRPRPEHSAWNLSNSNQQAICLKVLDFILQSGSEVLESTLNYLSNAIIEDLQTSLPEQSKDYIKSQDSIIAQANRRYSLQSVVLKSKGSDIYRSLFTQTSAAEIRASISTLKARNGKPYSAAATIEIALRLGPEYTLHHKDTVVLVAQFVQAEVPVLLLTPSSAYLLSILQILERVQDTREVYQDCIRRVVKVPNSTAKYKALESLISSPRLGKVEDSKELIIVVKDSLQQAMDGNNECWSLVNASIGNPYAPNDLTDELLTTLTEGLAIADRTTAALRGLEMAVKHNGKAVKAFSTSSKGSRMLSRLLFLTESADDDASLQARSLSTAVETIISSEKGSNLALRSMVEIISKGLDTAESSSLSIESLVEQAQKLLSQTAESEKSSLAVELLPDITQWTRALKPFLEIEPDKSLAITNAIGGAISMIDQTSTSPITIIKAVSRDPEGYSPALRMAWYTMKIINLTDVFKFVASNDQADICQYMALIIQLASDNLSVPQSNCLWEPYSPDAEIDIVDFVADSQALLAIWLHGNSSSESDFLKKAQEQLLAGSRGLSVAAYYNARAYAAITAELSEMHGFAKVADEDSRLKTARKTPDVFAAIGLLTGTPESKALLKLCNELMADLTGQNFHKNGREGIRQLVLLNFITQRQHEVVEDVPQQRLVFAVKHFVSQLQGTAVSSSITTEICKALTTLLPPIKHIYGSFWADVLDILIEIWHRPNVTEDESIPLVHATLKLCAAIGTLAAQGSNDDLQDSWGEKQKPLMEALLALMKRVADQPDGMHQPRRIVNELLTRLLSRLSAIQIDDPPALYHIIASESAVLQQCAYELLHRQILEQQEQVSIDAALSENSKVELPEELSSLILAAPTMRSLVDTTFLRTIPLTLRSYLLSWKLVFDHWTNASYKVQTDYADCIKEGKYLRGLMDFTFDFLIASRPKPVDASRFDIESYTLNMEESPEKETQWLLIHLYYLCLKHLPALSMAWWRDNSPRHLSRPVEAWTENYISPLIIQYELSNVTAWITTQPSDDQTMQVKVSPKTREITASYPIDDQVMSIVIRLPTTYPLSRVLVEGLHRVGVSAEKWNSWLLTTQGVISFSSSGGALIDGLAAWRKNVQGTLKGQSECAICYSVVGSDKQLPSKRCGTCKNLFHSGCLFKWFKSSNSSSCPLCRNAFHYG